VKLKRIKDSLQAINEKKLKKDSSKVKPLKSGAR
jgi:penicillin-binding protein 2